MDANIKMQTALSQDILSKKEKQIEELNCVCKQLKDKLSQLDSQLRYIFLNFLKLYTIIKELHFFLSSLMPFTILTFIPKYFLI